MDFTLNTDLLTSAAERLSNRRIYWITGGAGSGKSTVCRRLSNQFHRPLIDMDSCIYGSYFQMLSKTRHPVLSQWASAENGFIWQLDLGWEAFLAFSRAVAAEYLDIFADQVSTGAVSPGFVDGGLWCADVLAQVIPACRILCLSAPWQSSRDVWESDPERYAMRDYLSGHSDIQRLWHTFLEYDRCISETVIAESLKLNVPLLERPRGEDIETTARKSAELLDLGCNHGQK